MYEWSAAFSTVSQHCQDSVKRTSDLSFFEAKIEIYVLLK